MITIEKAIAADIPDTRFAIPVRAALHDGASMVSFIGQETKEDSMGYSCSDNHSRSILRITNKEKTGGGIEGGYDETSLVKGDVSSFHLIGRSFKLDERNLTMPATIKTNTKAD